MFRTITGPSSETLSKERAQTLFRAHPIQLNALLEYAWSNRRHETELDFGHPNLRSELSELPACLLEGMLCAIDRQTVSDHLRRIKGNVQWEHLIYAYLVENTRVFEVFQRVIHEFRHGEKLGAARMDTQHWLRNTEELFFRASPTPFISSVTSQIRPDERGNRRNAYWRMFGMDLNHGTDDGKPYPFTKSDTANQEFVNTLENFLHQVWIGVVNQTNASGPNPTDDAVIGNYANQIFDMLRTRRQYGNLSREEFWYTATMSWFHLTLEFDSPIVIDLRAEGSSPEQRLFNIAKRVGLPAHARSEQFIRMAPKLSRLLKTIETGTFNDVSNVKQLYSAGYQLRDLNFQIIADWEQATGHNVRKRDYRQSHNPSS